MASDTWNRKWRRRFEKLLDEDHLIEDMEDDCLVFEGYWQSLSEETRNHIDNADFAAAWWDTALS